MIDFYTWAQGGRKRVCNFDVERIDDSTSSQERIQIPSGAKSCSIKVREINVVQILGTIFGTIQLGIIPASRPQPTQCCGCTLFVSAPPQLVSFTRKNALV